MFSYFSLRKVDMFFGITHVIGSNIKEVMICERKKIEVEKIDYLFAVIMNLNVSEHMLSLNLGFQLHGICHSM